jgi:hypothetical protein
MSFAKLIPANATSPRSRTSRPRVAEKIAYDSAPPRDAHIPIRKAIRSHIGGARSMRFFNNMVLHRDPQQAIFNLRS